MKLTDESGSTVLYFHAKERDELELDGDTDAVIRLDCRDGRTVLDVAVDADQDVDGVRRKITEKSNRQFSMPIPPSIVQAAGFVDAELVLDVDSAGRSFTIGRKAD